jgi:hypothetical protein
MARKKPSKGKQNDRQNTVKTMNIAIPISDQKKETSDEIHTSAPIDDSKEPVDNDIFLFFRENGNILAAIGLIGTMISFLPSFAEKLNDDVWLGTFSNFQIAFLFLSIITGITFIFLLFLSIWDKYSDTKFKLPFIIILLFFSIFLISFESFIYLAIRKYTYVQYVILSTYIILAIFISLKFKGETKKAKNFGFYCILFLLSLIIINAAIVTLDFFNATSPNSTNTRIQTDVNYYSPLIPHSYGIGFSPISDKKISFKDYNVNWTTNFGYFYYMDSGIGRIRYLGNTTTNHGELVYWTYEKDKIGIKKPSVNISMNLLDQTNKSLVLSSVKINWSSDDIAQVGE